MLKYILFCCCALAACSINPKLQNRGAKYLQGQWQQDSTTYANDLVEYKQCQYRFTCDSFYLVLNNFSKAGFGQDTCYKNNRWKEYVKGVYSLSGDTIILKGAYVSSAFKLKKTPCFTTGGFDETLVLLSKQDSVLVLKSFINGKICLKLQYGLTCKTSN